MIHLKLAWVMIFQQVIFLKKHQQIIKIGLNTIENDLTNSYCLFYRYADLISRMVYWGTLTDKDTIKQLKKAISIVRGVQDLKVGSLVLARVSSNPMKDFLLSSDGNNENNDLDTCWIFARVAGHIRASMVLLYTDPTEKNIVSLTMDRILPVSNEMINKYIKKEMPSEVRQKNKAKSRKKLIFLLFLVKSSS